MGRPGRPANVAWRGRTAPLRRYTRRRMGHGEHDDEPLDEGHDDDASRGAPPDPMDRIWLHPTELPALTSGLVGASPPPTQAARKSRLWALPVVGGAAGALVTVAALAMVGAFDRDTSPENRASLFPVRGSEAHAIAPDNAARTELSLVAVAARDKKGTRRGSGVCVRHSGGVLTSARLVGDAATVDVLTKGGDKYTARVVGRDRTTDLVLLAIDEPSVPAAHLAEEMPAAGAAVWVLGAARSGAHSWVSSGTLSTTDALVAVDDGPTTTGLLETDATTGSTGAGGALIDDNGSVVGIVLARIGASGTTYAVPIEEAVAIAEELDEHGTVAHGSTEFDGVDGPQGPTVMSVVPGGAAARAGVQPGDVVISIDGRPVESIRDVTAIVRSDTPGNTLTFELRRGKTSLRAAIELTTAAA
jgi:S1-C subfamily serine protease